MVEYMEKEGLDQPVRMAMLIRTFAVRMWHKLAELYT